MKKVYLSLLAVFLVLVIVSGAAYSLFWPSVSISGVTFSTSSAELQVTSDGDFSFNNMFPGNNPISENFNLKNNSISNISLNLSAKLGVYTQNPDGSWDALKNFVMVRISNGVGTTLTDWKTLDYFSETGIANFDTSLAVGTTRPYTFEVKLSSTTPDTASGKGLQDVSIVFTGTQN